MNQEDDLVEYFKKAYVLSQDLIDRVRYLAFSDEAFQEPELTLDAIRDEYRKGLRSEEEIERWWGAVK